MPHIRVLVGVFGAPHGVRGEVRLKSYTEDPAAVTGYGALESEDGARRFTVRQVGTAKDMLIVRVAGVADRDAAAALTNLKLYVPRAQLPAAEGEEFYYADLLSLPVEDDAGAPIGTVVGVENFGAGDLLEIAPAGGGPTAYLPFSREVVPTVDLAARRIVAHPPQGWNETAEDEEPQP
jgi:16S rRNA processing protein RimM